MLPPHQRNGRGNNKLSLGHKKDLETLFTDSQDLETLFTDSQDYETLFTDLHNLGTLQD